MKKLTVLFVMLAGILFLGCNENQMVSPISRAGGRVEVSDLYSKALDIIAKGLEDDNGLVRSNAVEAVSTTKLKMMMPEVRKLLRDEFVGVRFAAAVAVGDMKYAPAKYTVKSLLKDKNANGVIAACYALARLGNSEHVDFIRQSIKSKDQTLRANSALLLGKLGRKKDLGLLYEALRDPDSSSRVQIQAAESIAVMGDKKIYETLWTLLISKYADERAMGIRAMGALRTDDARIAIATMLEDDVPEVRLCAAEQLGRLGDRSGEGEVIDYFTRTWRKMDQRRVADGIAAMAIGRIGGDVLISYLPAVLNSPVREVRISAAQSVILLSK